MTLAYAKSLHLSLAAISVLASLSLGVCSQAQAADKAAREKYENFKQTLHCVDEYGDASRIQVIRLDGKMTGKIEVASLSSKTRQTAKLQFGDKHKSTAFANLKTFRYEINLENFEFDGTARGYGEVIKGSVGQNDCVEPYYHGQACGWWGPAISCITKDTRKITKGLGLVLWPTFDETDVGVQPTKKGEYIYIFSADEGSLADQAGLNLRGEPTRLLAIEMNGQWLSTKDLTRKVIREFIAQQPLDTEIQVKVARENQDTKALTDEKTLKLKVYLFDAKFD
jgi:hypothetical protein